LGKAIQRREFITLLGGTAAAWPLAARAQQLAMPVIGFLHTRSPDAVRPLAGFRRGLAESGYIEGQTATIEYRWAEGQYDRLPALAAELVRHPVAVLVAGGGEPSPLAAKAATSTIPIVFAIGSDPVKAGLVASYNRPGGNVTGINILTDTLEPKRFGLLHELVPQAATIGFVVNARYPSAESQVRDVREAARALTLKIHVLPAGTDGEIDAAFETVARERIPAIVVAGDPFFDTRRDKLVALAARHAVPIANRNWHSFRRGHCRRNGTTGIADHLRHWRDGECVLPSGGPDQAIRVSGCRVAAGGRNGWPGCRKV
jgi:putative ABC transport system substrate-binding protein